MTNRNAVHSSVPTQNIFSPLSSNKYQIKSLFLSLALSKVASVVFSSVHSVHLSL